MDTPNTVDVKATLAGIKQEFVELEARLKPLMNELKPIVQAAQTAHNYGLTVDMTADQIIDFFAHRVSIKPPEVALVPSVLSAGAPREIEQAGQQLLATYRAIGALIGNIGGIIAGLR